MSPWRSRNKRRYPCSDIVSNRHRGHLFERQRPAASIGRLALSTIGPGVYTSWRRGVAWQRLAIERRASGTCCTIETADVAPVTALVAPGVGRYRNRRPGAADVRADRPGDRAPTPGRVYRPPGAFDDRPGVYTSGRRGVAWQRRASIYAARYRIQR